MREKNVQPLYDSQRYASLFSLLKLDCARCSGLCCAALYFSSIDGFPYDKPANQPCSHLMQNFQCDAHAHLMENGWKGCRDYDCFGAGNFVTSSLYHGMSWKDNDTRKKDIFDMFLIVHPLFQMLFYLCEAAMLSQGRTYQSLMDRLINQILALSNDIEAMKSLDMEELRNRINPLLKQAYRDCTGAEKKKQDKHFYHFNQSWRNQNLCFRDFSMSFLIGCDLSDSDVYGACFLGADVRDVKVLNCDLSNCIYLTQGQVNVMIGNQNTKLPWFLVRPAHWKSKNSLK